MMKPVPEQIQDVRSKINGYKLTELLVTAENLGVFDALSRGSSSIDHIEELTGIHVDRLSVLLNALAGNGILSFNGSIYSFSENYSVLNPNHPASQNNYLRYASEVKDKWLRLSDAMKDEIIGEQNFNEITGENYTATRKFVEAMDSNAKPQATFIRENYDFENHSVLDIGAGAGTYSISIGSKFKNSSGVLLELPGVVSITQEFVNEHKINDRFKVVEGNYNNGLPDGPFNDVFLFAVVHQEPPEKTAALISRIYENLSKGGRLYLTSFFLDDSQTAPLFSVMFGIEMIVMNSKGKVYTHSEILGILKEAKFGHIDRINNIPGPSTLYIATK